MLGLLGVLNCFSFILKFKPSNRSKRTQKKERKEDHEIIMRKREKKILHTLNNIHLKEKKEEVAIDSTFNTTVRKDKQEGENKLESENISF